jgi:hypothetical protein
LASSGSSIMAMYSWQSGSKDLPWLAASATISLPHSTSNTSPMPSTGATLSISVHTAYWMSPTLKRRPSEAHVLVKKSWLNSQFTALRFCGFSSRPANSMSGAYVLCTAAL